MSSTFNLSAKGWFAIGIIVCVLAAFAISTAALDSTPIHLVRYKTWLSHGPIELFAVFALIWPFASIWYSTVRITRDPIPVRKAFIQNPT